MTRRVLSALVLGALAAAGGWWLKGARDVRRLEQGARLYRQGIGLDGQPVKALVNTDLALDGTMMTCASCHLRAGYGSFEGQLVAPPIAGDVLFSVLKTTFKGVEVKDAPPRRPAYTSASLAAALRNGVDPNGRKLNEAMPRFLLSDDEVAVLADYLASLASARSAGVTDDSIVIATIVSTAAPSAERATMLFALEKYVAYQNSQTQPRVQGLDNRSARMSKNMLGQSRDVAYKQLQLEVWDLEGSPQTWAAQLDAHLRRRPVFALVSGLVDGPWAPIAAFADAHHVPTVFPLTDLPVTDARADSSTLYLSLGAWQEGEALAGQLTEEVVEWVGPDDLSRARARGFDETRARAGRSAARRLTDLTAAVISGQTSVIVWAEPGVTAQYEAAAGLESAGVFGSAVALSSARTMLSATARQKLRFTWPARDTTQERTMHDTLRPWLKDSGRRALDPSAREYVVAASGYAAMQVFANALMDLRGHYTGDALLDVLGMQKDQRLPWFERLSFGAGQRYASKGVWLVEVDPQGELVPRSEWLTH